MEPLHAADAARRLMGNDSVNEEMETAPFAVLNGTVDEDLISPMLGENTNTSAYDGNESRSALSNSLFERIQQQKNQRSSSLQPIAKSTTQYSPANNAGEPYPPTASSEGPFGHPMTEDVNYSYSEQPSAQESQLQMNVPQYSSTPRPDPYDAGGTDYKSQIMGVFSSVGSVANTAVSGTKHIYSNIVSSKKNDSAVGSTSGGMVNEMDYQRRSLLMDPHDLEERVVPVSAPPPSVAPRPVGMIGGLEEGNNADFVRNQGYSMVGYANQFLVDVKDLFLAAPPYVKALIVGLCVLISWLLFF